MTNDAVIFISGIASTLVCLIYYNSKDDVVMSYRWRKYLKMAKGTPKVVKALTCYDDIFYNRHKPLVVDGLVYRVEYKGNTRYHCNTEYIHFKRNGTKGYIDMRIGWDHVLPIFTHNYHNGKTNIRVEIKNPVVCSLEEIY